MQSFDIRYCASAVLVCSTLACGGSSNLPSSEELLEGEVAIDRRNDALDAVIRFIDWTEEPKEQGIPSGIIQSAKFSARKDGLSEAMIEIVWARDKREILALHFRGRFQPEELRQIAEDGFAWAQYDLGHRYLTGKSHLEDFERGEYWVVSAGEQGYAPAMYDLMRAYSLGDPFLKNTEKALFWAGRLAEQGAAADTNDVATSFYWGDKGLPEDKVEAMRLLELAAEKGNSNAMHWLGMIYRTDDSYMTAPDADKDDVLAYMWLNLASSRNVLNAFEPRKLVRGLLSHAEILKGQQLAREWDEAHPRPSAEFIRFGVGYARFLRGLQTPDQSPASTPVP